MRIFSLAQWPKFFVVYAVVFLFRAPPLHAQSQAQSCQLDSFFPAGCEMFSQQKGILADFGDGTYFTNETYLSNAYPVSMEEKSQLDGANSRNAFNQKRVKKYFDELKQAAVEIVLNGRARENISPEEKNLLSRLTKVELEFSAPDHPRCARPKGKSSMLNAGYWWGFHVITICPVLVNQHAMASVPVLAHELGHVVDPVNSAESLFRIIDNVPAAELSTCDSYASWETLYQEKSHRPYRLSKDETYKYAPPYSSSSPLKQGCYAAAERMEPPIGLERHPFQNMIQCLSSDESRRSLLASPPDGRLQPLSFDEVGAEQEYLADWFGSKVTGRYLAKLKQPLTLNEKRSLLIFYAATTCGDSAGSYGLGNNRLAMFLENKATQKALGCSENSFSPVCGGH